MLLPLPPTAFLLSSRSAVEESKRERERSGFETLALFRWICFGIAARRRSSIPFIRLKTRAAVQSPNFSFRLRSAVSSRWIPLRRR
ncbi:hypothetical protein HPP92_020091 [Vanilla planifolia]|uniref:Uncharacterized protein n=1 Tax=Vanilla planifolia TaxID=51239 RepID=A0A835QA18_VANPL|nr:hypothetical protein HPP92_020091 [Vanilla planifolia]